VPFTLIAWAEIRTDANLATILNSLSPIFAFLFTAVLTQHERVTGRKLFGVGTGLIGVGVIVGAGALTGLGHQLPGQLAIIAARFTVAADHPEDTVFRTGDLGHLDQHGVLHFDGRADDQIKLYGTRVHLRAVEAVLEQQPGIDHAAVVASPDSRGGAPRLTAHLVLEPGHHTIPTDLRMCLYERLPAAAVPARFVVTNTLPTTAASGKNDYRRLAGPTTADTLAEAGSQHQVDTPRCAQRRSGQRGHVGRGPMGPRPTCDCGAVCQPGLLHCWFAAAVQV